jgi:hypothetical protein
MWWLSPTPAPSPACALAKPAGADNHEAALGLGLLSGEHSTVTVLADSAHGTGEFPKLAERGHIDRVKPAQSPRPIPGGFIVDDFTVDHADAKRLKDLGRENSTLKRVLADAGLEKAALMEIAKENF